MCNELRIGRILELHPDGSGSVVDSAEPTRKHAFWLPNLLSRRALAHGDLTGRMVSFSLAADGRIVAMALVDRSLLPARLPRRSLSRNSAFQIPFRSMKQ